MDYINDKTITIYAEAVRTANNLGLSQGERAIYNIIYSFCTKGKNKECSQSLEFFAQWTGLTRQGVVKTLRSLEELELIKRQVFCYNDSDVVRCKYTLVPREVKTREQIRSERSARTQLVLEQFKQREKEKKLRALGLEPVPFGYEGKCWIAMRRSPDGQCTLIADGVNKTFDQRYYSPEEYAAFINNVLVAGSDWTTNISAPRSGSQSNSPS